MPQPRQPRQPVSPRPSSSSALWTRDNLAQPHDVDDKAMRVEAMFAAIADSYDLNNRLHSLGRDQAWRKAAVRMARLQGGETVLDVACGTGDLAMAFADASPAPSRVLGVDFTYNMLAVAKRKAAARSREKQSGVRLDYQLGDAMQLPIADASVDVVSIAFGIRNVARPQAAMAEFFRVLKPGGRLIVLEFSLPQNPLMRGLYNFYFRHIMPRTAAFIARDKSGAYKYLPQSVSTFITRQQMLDMMTNQGFTHATSKPLTLGIAIAYQAISPSKAPQENL